MKINVRLFFPYMIVLFAILNGPLRISDGGMTSFYRMTAPIIGLILLIKYFKFYKKDFLFLGMILVYSFMASLLSYQYIELTETVIVIYVFLLYTIIKYIKKVDKNFNNNFLRFLNFVWIVTIVLAWIQYLTHYSVPFMDNATVRKGAVNVYFSNENELGSALACIALINVFYMFYLDYYKKIYIQKIIVLFGIISSTIILFLNDAKLSFLGFIVGVLLIYAYKVRRFGRGLFRLGDRSWLKTLVAAFLISIIVLFSLNPSISTRDYDISIREMLFDNIIAVITMKEISGAGTYHDRAQAIIYGLIELKKSFFVGIGLGNSWTMLQMPQYKLLYAKSMHNIIFQILVELGFLAIFIYTKIIKALKGMFSRVTKFPLALLRAMFCVAFVFISSQSSSGILSNYLTIISVIYVGILDEEYITVNTRGFK